MPWFKPVPCEKCVLTPIDNAILTSNVPQWLGSKNTGLPAHTIGKVWPCKSTSTLPYWSLVWEVIHFRWSDFTGEGLKLQLVQRIALFQKIGCTYLVDRDLPYRCTKRCSSYFADWRFANQQKQEWNLSKLRHWNECNLNELKNTTKSSMGKMCAVNT